MLQPTPNQTELRLMVSKSIFNVDSKNVSEKFLHRHSWKNVFFFKTYLGGPKEKIWKKGFFQEWRWRNFLLTFLESTLKMDLETINLSSIWFGCSCNIGWVTSVYTFLVQYTWFIFQVNAIAIKQGLFLTHANNAAYMSLQFRPRFMAIAPTSGWNFLKIR